MSEKILNTVARLLAKAESTDSEAEAEALVSKAQSLATTHAIDIAVARQHTQQKQRREQPIQRRITVAERGSHGRHHFVDLFLKIARNNDVQCNIAHNKTYVIAFGFPSDVEVCEALFASLAVQMVDTAARAIKAGEHKREENRYWSEAKYDWYGDETKAGEWRTDARVFRASFYEGFGHAVYARLAEARHAASEAVVTTAQGETTGTLVLVQKSQEVSAFYDEKSDARGSYRGGSSTARVVGGLSSGTAAGRSARLSSQPALSGAKGSLR